MKMNRPVVPRSGGRLGLPALGLWLAVGCGGSEPELVESGPVDADNDGFTADVDCDDSNSTIFPGAPERCDNGLDNDCDGLTYEPESEDATDWYIDADQDGFGSPDFVERACVQPRGWVSAGDDCDDADASTFPGAAFLEPTPLGGDPLCMRDVDSDGYGDSHTDTTADITPGTDCDDSDAEVHPDSEELCDGVDTDCDGGVESSELDEDGDSFVVCERSDEVPWRGEGTITDGGDCNDDNADSFPGKPETCADDFDNDCDGFINEADAFDAPMWFRDADGDGYGNTDLTVIECDPGDGWTLVAGDCNDLRADVSPLGIEVCDDEDEDENCDGVSDDSDAFGKVKWFRDADGDGWGDAASTTDACNQPSGYIAYTAPDAVDCDDGDASVAPGADEYCNDIDDDCDGDIDEDDSVDASTWYQDADGDGFGVVAGEVTACAQPSGFTDNIDDCDDRRSDVNPDQDEVCDPLDTDEDCDGSKDRSTATDAVYFYVDYDGDGFGLEDTTLAVLSCPDENPADWLSTSIVYVQEQVDGDGDGETDDDDGFDCDDSEPLRNPSESDELEACYDQISDNDCSDETVCHLESSYVAGELSSLEQGLGAFGSALVAVDNYDGAGSPAVLVSDPSNSRVVLYKVDASELNSVTAYNYLEVGSPKAFTSGTFYANGASDLVVGAPDSYATYLIYGPLTGSSGVPDVTFTSAGVDYGAGSSVAAIHDLDGNGTGELLIGGVDSTNNGRAWLLDAPLVEMSLADCTADEESEDADSDEDAEEDDEDTEDNTDQYRCTELITSTEGDGFATLVASAGDLDADGRDELLVTAPYGDAGAVYLLGGPVSGTVAVDVDATVLTGEIADDEAGTSVSGGADMDGDGYNDLLVGAPNAALGRGEAYLVRGPVSASVALRAADVVFRGAKADGGAGESVAFAGDINGDGNQDIAIGAPNISTVWVVYGPVSGTVDLSDAEITITDDSTATTSSATDPSSVDASGTGLGEALLGLGDVAGSYTNDLYISEPQSGSDAGRVGLLRGMLP